MKIQIDRTSFFGCFSHSSKTATQGSHAEQENLIKSAWIIQRWWKQLHLKQTAEESLHYVHDIVSLAQAQKDSFSKLEQFILEPTTLSTTRKLLMHLEQTKDIVLPSRLSLSTMYQAERQFLSAYLIATKSPVIFESPDDTDTLLLSHAEDMLQSFEDLCAFMSTVYLKDDETPSSPLADKTPSADKVFFNFNAVRQNNDHLFITEGHDVLEIFHQKQLAYYELFAQWESKNRYKLTHALIDKYLQIESKRFVAFNSLDPRMLEFCQGYDRQKATLEHGIHSLLGTEGDCLLTEALTSHQRCLEANKWTMSPEDSLLHELALNPQLRLPLETCMIKPLKDIDTAIGALNQTPPNAELILDVLEEIRNKLALFTPPNRQYMIQLQETFSHQAMQEQIQTKGLQEGLLTLFNLLTKEAHRLESPAHGEQTMLFLDTMNHRAKAGETNTLLRESIYFLYNKMSEINHETKNAHITQASGLIGRNIVALEQQKFQERRSAKQFNLEYTSGWLDTLISNPSDFRLNLPILCSKYLGTYTSHALLIAILQESHRSFLYTIPETFYLDRTRLVNWHTQYQELLYTVTALSYLETFCQAQAVTLSPTELFSEKNRLLERLRRGELSTPQEKADDLIAAINQQLVKKNKELPAHDSNALTTLVEKNGTGANEFTKLLNKRLGDQLSLYLFKGYLPKSSVALVKKYGLETELSQLGNEIVPTLRLHTKVHGAFYQQQMEHRLWSPLFTSLKETTCSDLPPLFSPETEAIKATHASLHKFAFVLSGLTLIQQMVVYSDLWHSNVTINNASLKELTLTFGLIDMIKNPEVHKDLIERQLIEVMTHVAHKMQLSFEATDHQKMTRMLRLAKKEQSSGCKAFLDELIHLGKKNIIQSAEDKEVNPNARALTAEFTEEMMQWVTKTKEIIERIKRDHVPEDRDPVAAVSPSMHSGRTADQLRWGM
jgi:hypothetical protein